MPKEVPEFEVPHPFAKHTKKLRILTRDEEKLKKAFIKASEQDFGTFYRGLTIASAVPRVFDNVGAPFQRLFFDEIQPTLHALRDGDMPKVRRFWVERTKKASKDADLAVCILWLVAFAKRPFYGQVAAADSSQAGIVKERVSDLLQHNPWLNDYVELVFGVIKSKKKRINGKDPLAKIDIIATDEGGRSHGATPDILIINELSHINKWKFVTTLMNNAMGVPRGVVVIATNAGFIGTKAEVWRKVALKSDDWCVHVLAKPAPWHSKKSVDDAKHLNLPSEQLRLWEGVWVSGSGNAVSEDKLSKAFCMNGPIFRPEAGWDYVMGLDLGVTHDHSGLVVLGVNFDKQVVRLVFWDRWRPDKRTKEVDLQAVEDACKSAWDIYHPLALWYDPDQAKFMMQRLSKRGVLCREMRFAIPSNMTKMASAYVQIMDSEKFECYDDEDGSLRRDFSKFNIEKKSYGHRLTATSDEHGHADVATAVVIALPHAVECLGDSTPLRSGDSLFYNETTELSEDEVKAMPDELREIYQMEEGDFGDEFDRVDDLDDLE